MNGYKKCKTCKFWDVTKYIRKNGINEFRQCSCPKIKYAEDSNDNDSVFYFDADRYKAVLYTGSDFCCKHWKV